MKILTTALAATVTLLAAAFIASAPLFAAEPTPNETTAAPQMSDAEMMTKMMELAKLNENHKLLAQLAGSWTYTTKMWMSPGAPPMETKGTASRKPIMDGRYFVANFTGPMEMPGADGRPHSFNFKGMSIEGYDNAKQKFVSPGAIT